MRFVYATRPLPQLEFATADERETIPDDAEVFAVCDGAMTIRRQHEAPDSLLTDQERSALEETIAEIQISESARAAVTRNHNGFLRRLFSRLLTI